MTVTLLSYVESWSLTMPVVCFGLMDISTQLGKCPNKKNDNECDECDNFGKWERKSSELLLLLGPNFIHFPVSEK